MGLRFRKSIKLAPGVKLNLGKKSAGVSVGGKYGGVSYNTKTGARARVSAPGTGLSYTTKIDGSDKTNSTKSNNDSGSGNGSCLLSLFVIFAVLIGLILVAQFFWIVGVIFIIFFRKKFNDDPKTQKTVTIIVGILSALSFMFMIGSMNNTTDNTTPTTTESQTNTEDDSEIIPETEENTEYELTTESELSTETASENATTFDNETISENEAINNTEPIAESEPIPATPIPETNVAPVPVPEPTPEPAPEILPTPQPEQTPEVPVTPPASEPVMVWVDDTAARYHSKNGCGMDNAYQVTLEEAQAMGKTPCGRCY